MDVEINPDYTMSKKRENGLFLSDEMIEVLEEFEIDYMSCKSLKELIYLVERCLEETDDSSLDTLLNVLSERDYYQNYRK